MSRLDHSVTPYFPTTCCARFSMAVDHTSSPRRTSTRDHFRALELHCEADADEIRSAYFRLVLTNHPDRNQGDADAAARFKKIQRAYEVLSQRSTLTRTEHLLRTPFMPDSFGVPTPGCEGAAKPAFAFSDSTSRRRNDAVRVGQWLVAATVATALMVMLRGLIRDKSLIATAPGVGSTQFADEALPRVRREQIDHDNQIEAGPAPAAALANATRRSEATSALPISRAGDTEVLAGKDFEKTWKSMVPASLLTLRDTLIMALDEKGPPEAVVGRLLGLKHDPLAADDSRSFMTFNAESDSRASISGSSRKSDTPGSRDDSTDDLPGLAHSRWYVPFGTPGELPEGDRYGTRYRTNRDYRWKVGSSTRPLDQGYRDPGSRGAHYGQSFDPVNDDRHSRPGGRVRSSPQRPSHFLNELPAGFNYAGFDSAAYDSTAFDSTGFNSTGFNSTGFNSTGFNSTGFDSAGLNSTGFNSAGFHSDGFHDGVSAKRSNSAAENRGKIRSQAWSESTPSYQQITPGASQLSPLPESPPLPESLARASIAPPSHIRARQAGALPEGDAQASFSSTTRANPRGQFDGGKSKWSGGLLDKGWRHRPTKDRRAPPAHYESAVTGLTSHRASPPTNNGLSPYSRSYEYRPNPQQVYSSSPPDRKLFDPHRTLQPTASTMQPAVMGNYSPSQW